MPTPDTADMISLDHLASDNPSKKQAIRERDMALARCSTFITCLDGLVGCYEAAKTQLPPAAFDMLRHFLEVEVRAAKLALVATQTLDLRARHDALVEAGFNQPAPEPSESRPVWEAIVADLTPHASSPAATNLLLDMRMRDKVGRERYGEPLAANNGRDALWDLYCEQLDAVAYAWQCIDENPDDYTLRQVYSDSVQMALGSRRRLMVRDMAKRLKDDPGVLLASLKDRQPVKLDLSAVPVPAPVVDDCEGDDDEPCPPAPSYRCASDCGDVESTDGLCPKCGDVAVILE